MKDLIDADLRKYLPASAHEIACVIGYDRMLDLLDAFGGRTIAVSKGLCEQGREQQRKIANVIGEDAAARFGHAFGGDVVSFPLCARAKAKIKDRRVRAEFDEMVRTMSATQAINELAERHQLASRSIWRITKRAD